jgi:hypothetical protein
LGVVVGRSNAFAAEEKKSPVVGGSRPGVLRGVLKTIARPELVGVGVVERALMNGSSSNSWSSSTPSLAGGQFSLLAESGTLLVVSSTVFVLESPFSEPALEMRFDLASCD